MEFLAVIMYKPTLPSLQWTEGLYALRKEEEGVLFLYRIKDGIIATGETVISSTSPYIHTTNLVYIKK